MWEHDLPNGLRLVRLDGRHPPDHQRTSPCPCFIRHPGGLVVEMTDGTREYNAERYRLSAFYDQQYVALALPPAWRGYGLAEH